MLPINTNPHLLVARVMKGIYGKLPIDKARSLSRMGQASWGYRSLCNAVMTFNPGMVIVIGNGEPTKLTEDIWNLKWESGIQK